MNLMVMARTESQFQNASDFYVVLFCNLHWCPFLFGISFFVCIMSCDVFFCEDMSCDVRHKARRSMFSIFFLKKKHDVLQLMHKNSWNDGKEAARGYSRIIAVLLHGRCNLQAHLEQRLPAAIPTYCSSDFQAFSFDRELWTESSKIKQNKINEKSNENSLFQWLINSSGWWLDEWHFSMLLSASIASFGEVNVTWEIDIIPGDGALH